MDRLWICIVYASLFFSCDSRKNEDVFSLDRELRGTICIDGKEGNGDFLYVTAGSQLYSIGDQKGNFPAVGFHVPGEMGGVWQHPIKLLDGFELSVNGSRLAKCDRFTTYPFANQFRYEFPDKKVSVVRTDFVPDSLPVLVVEYVIRNGSSEPQVMDLGLRIQTDLSPVWLGERSGMIDTPDTLIGTYPGNLVVVKDSLNTWFAGISSEDTLHVESYGCSEQKGQGIGLNLHLPSQEVKGGGEKVLRFYMMGSAQNVDEVERNSRAIRENVELLFNEKKERYARIDRQAEITVPDTLLTQAYRWGKYNTDWLVREVPGMGRGINAGLPDYPWFFSNDQAATFNALVGTIDPQLFYDSWDMLSRISKEANDDSGRIIHEVSTNGQVYDKGRMEESQGFINASWTIFKWTGNMDFLKTYYEQGKKVWEFLQAHDTNHNLYVEGYGGVEIEGLNDEMLDVAVATQHFLSNMSRMAAVLGDSGLSKEYGEKAETLRKKINEDWWSVREKRYFDFIADKDKAVKLIDMALEKRVSDDRNRWAKEKLSKLKADIQSGTYDEKGYTVFYSAPVGVLEAGIADDEKAVAVLEGMPFFTNKYGLYISGIARPDDITLEEGSVAHRLKGEFNYHEAIMTIGTSGLAIVECKYRGSDYAMPYIRQILNNFSFATPGSTYEVCPDYGMFVQAWNVSGINIPLIQYMFGVDPMAYLKEITLKPDMPSDWEFAKLERLLIGDNELSVDFKKSGEKCTYTIDHTKEGWTVHMVLPGSVKTAQVNGKTVNTDQGKIVLNGLRNVVVY